MNLDIFTDAQIMLEKAFDNLKHFVDKNFDNPIFWILMVVALLALVCYGIQALNND